MHYIVMKIIFLIMENHGIVFLNFCGNPDLCTSVISSQDILKYIEIQAFESVPKY